MRGNEELLSLFGVVWNKNEIIIKISLLSERSDFMVMTSLEIKLPSPAKDYVMDNTTDEMRNALLLYPSIANNTISHGRAAELLGMRKMELIELYSRLGIPYLDMTEEEFEEEIQTIKRVMRSKA